MKLPVVLLIVSLMCLSTVLISNGQHIWAGVFAFLGFLKMFDRGEH